jgi:hypothetical protein
MEIRKIKNSLDNNTLLKYFSKDQLIKEDSLFENEFYYLSGFEYFDPYVGSLTTDTYVQKMMRLFKNVSNVIDSYSIPSNYYEDGTFWKSTFLTLYREELNNNYPAIIRDETTFNNVIGKKWGWENYIFKAILVKKYLPYAENFFTKEEFYETVAENIDVFNYLVKGPIFRNDKFIVKILKIIKDEDLVSLSKRKIQNRPDLGSDERIGRRAIYEMNKIYPIIMVHNLEIDQLKEIYIKSIRKYT